MVSPKMQVTWLFGQASKEKDDLKNEDNLKNEDDFKNEGDLENWPSPPNFFLPHSHPLEKLLSFFLMTSYRDSHKMTDVKPKMIPGF